MEKILFDHAFYIKLGEGGKYEKDCLQDNCLRLGYREVTHELCLAGRWDEAKKSLVSAYPEMDDPTAKNHIRQVRTFYEANETCIWITFIDEKLYWGHAKKEIRQLTDKSKVRPIVGKWSCKDTKGETLYEKKLSGKITKTKGYQGTICPIKDDAFAYLLRKINGDKIPEVEEAIDSKNNLELKIGKLLTHLQPYDFEILVELIFTRAGLQKISQTGGTQKGIDIRLSSPITGEEYFVQVKSKSDYSEYLKYKQISMDEGYSRFFFVVHTPKGDLSKKKISEQMEDLWLASDVAKLAIKYGLAEWIIDRTG